MKTIFYLMAILSLGVRAQADPNRYEWRSFGGVNVHLQPLFSWWTITSQMTNEPLDITDIDSNKLSAISNAWLQLPARPLPQWHRILAMEGEIVIVGTLWKVNATIEPAPAMVKHQIIYLRNPPTREIQDYKTARSDYQVLQGAQEHDVAVVQFYQTNLLVQTASLSDTNAPGYAPPGTPEANAAVQSLQENTGINSSNILDAQSRILTRSGRLDPLEKYLAAFPDKTTYWVDHFALRTGEQADGLDIYDLGMATGLNY